MTVLGTPIAMENEISKIAAEIARRGRKAYWAHGKMWGRQNPSIWKGGNLPPVGESTQGGQHGSTDTPTQHAQARTQAHRSLNRVECPHPPDGEGEMERENSGPGVAPVGAHGKEGRATSAGDSVERASMVERTTTRQSRPEAPSQVQPQPGNGEDGDCNRRREVERSSAKQGTVAALGDHLSANSTQRGHHTGSCHWTT